MSLKQWMMYCTTGFMIVAVPAMANGANNMEQLQVPQCLASQLSPGYKVLSENQQFKIIDVPSNEVEKIIYKADQVHCGRFVNVSSKFTNLNQPKEEQAKRLLSKPTIKALKQSDQNYEIKHQAEVEAAMANVVSSNITDTLTHLTNFPNRSASKKNGVDAANWLKESFDKLATEYGRTDTTSYLVKTGKYIQPSVVTVIGKDIAAPAIVIGAHMDTLDGRMPGADDDGSGSSSVMEMARVLLSEKLNFKRPIYIIWYAAEERGLVGSQYVVEDFENKNIPVKAAIQFDMTGYRSDESDPTMWVYTDYTDKKLNKYLTKLIEFYIKVPVKNSECGYGCSDHASWTAAGVPAGFPFESRFGDEDPYIHTSNDVMSVLNLEHMTNFTKLGLAYAIELASE